MRALALLLLASCAATTPATPIAWRGDVRFTNDERAAILEGEAWIATQGGHPPAGVTFDLKVSPSDPPAPWTIRRERGSFNGQSPAGLCLHYEGEPGALYIDAGGRSINLETLPGITAHEMAHCRYGFVDGYGGAGAPSDGIMRVVFPMRWTASEEAQCLATDCRDAAR